MKSLDDIKPRSNNTNWRDGFLNLERPKKPNEWAECRILGGVFSYAQHWVKYISKDNKEIKFPVDCLAWDPDRDEINPQTLTQCPGCQAGIKPGVKYLLNVIDRKAQRQGVSQYIRVLELPPTAMHKILGLKSLNKFNGDLYSIGHKLYGCDLSVRLVTANNKTDWEIQKGERAALTEDELRAELYDFEAIYAPRDASDARLSLVRAGYFKDEQAPTRDAGYTSMPVSGTQMPPSVSKPVLQQSVPAITTLQNLNAQPVMPEQNTILPSVSSAPQVMPQTISGGLGRPPETNMLSDKPSCFGGFLGNLDCPKCPHKPACLVLTQEREEG